MSAIELQIKVKGGGGEAEHYLVFVTKVRIYFV